MMVPRWSKAGRPIVLAASLLVIVILIPIQSSWAQCVGPSITLSPTSGPAGSRVTIFGKDFLGGCNDTSLNGVIPPPPPPAKGIGFTFVQGARSWYLGKVNANKDYSFAFTVTVPRNAILGSGQFRATGTFPRADFQVTNLALTGGILPTRILLSGLLFVLLGSATLLAARKKTRER